MMTVESSFIPFPSEIAMIPAGYNAALGNMNLYIAFFAGTFGAMLGATINYFLGKKLGGPVVRKLIHKYGKYIYLKESHYIKSETYFKRHGAITTLVGRFIPAIRQLISIPAGIFHMNYLKFLFYTTLGAGIWNAVLLYIGYVAGQNDQLVRNLTSQITLWLIIILGLIIILYISYVKKHTPELKELEEEIIHPKK
ncbi:DedA family protein [Candidatus Gracilibacteria bacterium]|nr:DedA family protein [Candidatus Gracilibacteria bacterium]